MELLHLSDTLKVLCMLFYCMIDQPFLFYDFGYFHLEVLRPVLHSMRTKNMSQNKQDVNLQIQSDYTNYCGL